MGEASRNPCTSWVTQNLARATEKIITAICELLTETSHVAREIKKPSIYLIDLWWRPNVASA